MICRGLLLLDDGCYQILFPEWVLLSLQLAVSFFCGANGAVVPAEWAILSKLISTSFFLNQLKRQ